MPKPTNQREQPSMTIRDLIRFVETESPVIQDGARFRGSTEFGQVEQTFIIKKDQHL